MNTERFLTTSCSRAAFTGGWRIGTLLPCLLLAATVSPAQDQQPAPSTVTFTTLVNFDGMNGGNPGVGSAMAQGTDGNIYGATQGANGNGTFFGLTPGGSLTESIRTPGVVLGSLVLGTDGNLYGTSGTGGAFGNGEVVKITPSGVLSTFYSFCALPNCADGSYLSEITLGRDGNFYGTTGLGGTGSGCGNPSGCGTAFKLTPEGTLTTLYNFCSLPSCADGEAATIIQGIDGNLYGTTNEGGTGGDGAPTCCGTVFKLTPKGVLTTLYDFCPGGGNCTDGARPNGPLVQATNGELYGTANSGGANCAGNVGGCGVAFKVTTSGAFTTLYSFCAQPNCTDGAIPDTALVQGSDGNLYGTTFEGGTGPCFDLVAGCGIIFKMTPGGTVTTLHEFVETDGGAPNTLLQDTNGSLYGTTFYGGTSSPHCSQGCGTIFRLSAGFKPFVEILPAVGKVRAAVQILGTNLTGATAVSFNGVAAAFTVVSESEITATVPAGATTGYVTVTTPKRTLKSNVKFQVRP